MADLFFNFHTLIIVCVKEIVHIFWHKVTQCSNFLILPFQNGHFGYFFYSKKKKEKKIIGRFPTTLTKSWKVMIWQKIANILLYSQAEMNWEKCVILIHSPLLGLISSKRSKIIWKYQKMLHISVSEVRISLPLTNQSLLSSNSTEINFT